MRYDAADRNLLRQLTLSQYKLKDQSSFFGFLWSFLNPLLMLGVLYAFFRLRLGGEIENYALYLLLGLVVYTHFTNSTSLGMRALRSTRELTTDAVFPKELLVLSTLISSSLEFFISMGVCLAIAVIAGVPITLAVLWLPAIIGAQLLLVLWVSFLLATVFPFAWDIDHIYHVFLRALFFITPIFYDISFVGDGMARRVVELNPLSFVMEAVRGVVLEGAPPPAAELAAFVLLNAVLLITTLALFRHFEPRFAEYV
jgi:ABC-type polysaccharide/polyol phosphate export permease